MFNNLIKEKTFMRMGKKTTICLITMDNGYEIVGTSACAYEDMYNYEIGKKYAEEDAMRKLNELGGFILQEHYFNTKEKMKIDERVEDDVS